MYFPSAEACYCLSIMMAGVVKNIRCLLSESCVLVLAALPAAQPG